VVWRTVLKFKAQPFQHGDIADKQGHGKSGMGLSLSTGVPVHVNAMQGDLDIWQGSHLLATLLRKNRNGISRICPAAPGQPLADLCPSFNLSVALALFVPISIVAGRGGGGGPASDDRVKVGGHDARVLELQRHILHLDRLGAETAERGLGP